MGILLIDCRVDDFGYRSELRDCPKLRQNRVQNVKVGHLGSGGTLRSGSKHRLCYASHQLKRARQGELSGMV